MPDESRPKRSAVKRSAKAVSAKVRERAVLERTPVPSVSVETRAFVPERAGSVLRRWYRPESNRRTRAPEALSGDLSLARRVTEGFPTEAVDEVLASGLVEPKVMYDIVIPRRTLADRKQKEKSLSPEQSDRLARLLRVYARAEDAIGDAARAHRWLHAPNRALGARPIDLLGSDAGSRAVEKVLGRIEHGVVS